MVLEAPQRPLYQRFFEHGNALGRVHDVVGRNVRGISDGALTQVALRRICPGRCRYKNAQGLRVKVM